VVLIPLCIRGVDPRVAGCTDELHPYTTATTLQGAPQLIAQGPVAALEFIKNLGTNGGGFFNANGAHPYENPTALSNFVENAGDRVAAGGSVLHIRRNDQSASPRLVALTR